MENLMEMLDDIREDAMQRKRKAEKIFTERLIELDEDLEQTEERVGPIHMVQVAAKVRRIRPCRISP